MNDPAHLSHIVILLCAAVFIVAVFRIVRLSPVIGYLAAGIAIGPFGLKLIGSGDTTTGFAEFGIIFLLFLIGLEMSVTRLRSMRTHVFGFGGAQLLVTGGLFAALFAGMGGDATVGVIIGGGLALSSTAIVLQVIAEQNEKSSQVGRLSLAILILQDLAVIPLLVLVSLPDNGQSLTTALIDAAFKAAVCLLLMFVFGRLFLRPLFRFIASLENTDLFTATTLLVVLGVAWITSVAGLSPALGAFMAGLLVAETEFKPQVEADILPFKGLCMGLFFMTVGMSLNLDTLLDNFIGIVTLTITLMAGKAIIIMGLSRLFGFSLSTAVHTGLLLSQGGEFAFILFALAAAKGIVPDAVAQVLLVVVTMSMALTPIIAEIGKHIAATLEKFSLSQPESIVGGTLDLHNHVIISGFGRVGHTVARILETEGLPFVAIDMDSFLVGRERKTGAPVYYGDATRLHVLAALGVARARALIITHSDTRVALQTIATVREMNRHLPIIARAKNIEQVMKLEKAGANIAVAEMFETSLQLSGALLRMVGITDFEVSRILDIFRAEDYALTRTAENEMVVG